MTQEQRWKLGLLGALTWAMGALLVFVPGTSKIQAVAFVLVGASICYIVHEAPGPPAGGVT